MIDDTNKLDNIVQQIADRVCEFQWWLWIIPTLVVMIGIKMAIYILDKREDDKLEEEAKQLKQKHSVRENQERIVIDERVVENDDQ